MSKTLYLFNMLMYNNEQMSLLTGVSDFFGLDIGTTAIRMVELKGGGPVKQLVKYAHAPIDSKLVLSDAKADQAKIAQAVAALVSQSGITSRNVAVGLPSQRVFTTVVDIDKMSNDELAKSIRFQADSLIPTPVAESKIDWSILGPSPKDTNKMEIILTSVINEYIENRLDMLEAIGLNVIAFEPDNLALSRAFVAPDSTAPQLVLDIGNATTDIVIMMNGMPRLTRSLGTGTQTLIRAVSQNLNIDESQARDLVFKFGLSRDRLEGQLSSALSTTMDLLLSDLEKSVKFFAGRYNNVAISQVIVGGDASVIPEFANTIANRLTLNVEIGNAWRNVTFSSNMQNELAPLAHSFGVAVGLAERKE